MYRRILVATDGSRLSAKAVKSAIDLAATTQAELLAVHVVPRYPVSYFEGAVALEPEQVAATERSWTEKGQRLVDAVRDQALARKVKARSAVVHSDMIAESILKLAKKHACDLIVMASHGRTGLKRLLLGSETQRVLTQADAPVLVLR